MKHTKQEYEDAIMNNKAYFENGDSSLFHMFILGVIDLTSDIDHPLCDDAYRYNVHMLSVNDQSEQIIACKLRLFEHFYNNVIKTCL